MSFIQLAEARYTTKQYDPTRKVGEADIQTLKEILRVCPSSINGQPWKFVFVSDETIKRKLSEVSFHNSQKINDASHIVVFHVVDDIEAFEDDIRLRLPEAAVGFYDRRIKPLSDAAKQSWLTNQVYLALGFFLSACAEMDIDSTPMEGIDTQAYASILQQVKGIHLEGYKTLFAVAIGYRDPDDANQPQQTPKKRRTLEDVIENV